MPRPTRRDFLKLAGLASGAAALSGLAPNLVSGSTPGVNPPNVIILVFDAMSARNLSLYGYQRNTTPNFEKFAERALVYHAHHSGGNFTSPGTATLLTGTYPWTHRALNVGGLIARGRIHHNIFAAFGPEYHRLAYSQNILPNYLFGQFEGDLDRILPPSTFALISQMTGEKFAKDLSTSYRAYDNFLFQQVAPPASVVFGVADRLLLRSREARALSTDYPRGLPCAGDFALFFRLDDVMAGLSAMLAGLNQPFITYLHLWAPHEPYRAAKQFDGIFEDNYRPPHKPDHPMGPHTPNHRLSTRRQHYDEYIANVDAEFGKLMQFLEDQDVLANSCVVVTADHGQSFERGLEGHVTRLLYEPLTQVPLMISIPGQQSRQDIYSPTSHIDLLPTLLHLTGQPAAAWAEGGLLPELGGSADPDQATFTVEAKNNRTKAPLTQASIAMYKGRHKLIYYLGFDQPDSFELYDLEQDYEELDDLIGREPALAHLLEQELQDSLSTANAAYQAA